MDSPTPEQVMPEGHCYSVENPKWSKFLAKICDLMEDLRHSSLFCRAAPCGRDPAGAVCEELQPVGRTDSGEFHGGLSLMAGTPCMTGDESEEFSS
ncbi:hypothetical protein TURU_045884 [Turdus rufiventris]|nr:hypothetical protein TURU_045884 [Turdus rufiventris]